MEITQTQDLRISVRGLQVGMFVSRLDRPWIETPFPLQGLALQDAEQVANISRLCSHVWVDPARGLAPDLRYLDLSDPSQAKRAAEAELAALRRNEWTLQSDFEGELRQAAPAFETIETDLRRAMEALSSGKRLDATRLRHGVQAMVDSVLRNPSAFAWLREMRRSGEYEYLHALGSSIWAASFGRHLGMDRRQIEELALGGMLCDLGKIRVPVELLTQSGPLDEAGRERVRQHVEHGLKILSQAADIGNAVMEMVATHHERHDGSGYPRGLAGMDIPIYGRIGGIVDSYDAMTSQRPYAPSRASHRAVSELYERRGSAFQPELIEQFIQACGVYPTGSLVELSDGSVGVVTGVHSLKRLRPTVMLLLDENKRPLANFRRVDLSAVLTDAAQRPLSIRNGLPAGAFGLDPHELFID